MAQKQTAILVKEYSAEKPEAAIDICPDAPVKGPADGEVRVRLTCRPVDPADVLSLQGYYPRRSI